MKRSLAMALALGLSTVGFVGCAEETGTKTETTAETPGGTTTTTVESEVKTTGDNPPPAPAPGEPAKTP